MALRCKQCAFQCASTARFCAQCGSKLVQLVSGVERMKLPLLVKTRPTTMTVIPPNTKPSPNMTQPTSPNRLLSTLKKKPTRIAKLEVEIQQQETPLMENYDLKLKVWMVSTRRLLESVLELKRRLDRPELEGLDPSRFQSIDHILHALELDLNTLEPCFVRNRNLQTKCISMLTKLKHLHHATQSQRVNYVLEPEKSPQHHEKTQSPPKRLAQSIPDAEVIVRGPDGKKIYFRARQKPSKRMWNELFLPYEPKDAGLVVVDSCPLDMACNEKIQCDSTTSDRTRRPSIMPLLRARWPYLLLFRVTRVGGRAVLLGVHESEELHQLVLEIYRPLTSTSLTITVPLEWLLFMLPMSCSWYRVSEVRRYKAVEVHWSRCLDHIVRCLVWTPPGNAITIRFPIQYRQARMFPFRSFAVFYGVVNVHVLPPDFALKIIFLNVRTHQRVTVTLSEKAIVRCLGDQEGYRERIVGITTRKTLCAQVCEKLYFEYTSRGFELLFPGVHPKGTIRRHPQEQLVLQQYSNQLNQEYTMLKGVMDQCIQRTVVMARRRLESYLERTRRIKKERQEAAAKKIQTRTRGIVAKRRLRREREDLRRTSRLQDLAAVLIQREFRRRQDVARQRRLQATLDRDKFGLRFRVCGRVCGAYIMAMVTLDELDAASNAFDCTIRGVHPSTAQTAQLRIAYTDVVRLLARPSLVGCLRSEIVATLVREHLDVFRSVHHHVLVLGTRKTNVAI